MTAKRVLLVTGLSGAGRTTALKALEDMGWEVADNLPIGLVDRLLAAPSPEGATGDDQPFAVGIDSRTRGFDAAGALRRLDQLRADRGYDTEILFLDAPGAVLARRFSETRRRHPLALDRRVADGIERERELLRPLRDAADHLVDTGDLSSDALRRLMRARFARGQAEAPTLHVTSFGFSRGLPRDADLVLDCRFLRNPHWEPALRPGTGLDADVAAYVVADPAYEEAMARIEGLILQLLPRYQGEGKSYVTIAFGCTGGRHRSVHVADRIGRRLREEGFSPTVAHRDLAQRTPGAAERTAAGGDRQGA